MIILRQKEFVQAATLTVPNQTAYPVQTQSKTPRFLRKARVSVYKTGKALNNAAWNLELNPQETIKRGIKSGTEYAARYPLVATGKSLGIPISSAVGYAVAGPEGMLYANASPVGVGTIIASVDPILHKTSPKYDRMTKKASEAVKNSKGFDQALDSIVGRDPQVTFRNSGPHAPFSEKLKYNIQSGVADISKGIQGAGGSVVKLLKRFSEEEEREYSSRIMKVVRTMKRAGNNIVTAVDNAGLKVGNTAKEIVTGKPTPAHMKVKFRPKTNQQINRETVQQVRGVQNIKNSAILDPEGFSGRVTKAAAEKVTTAPLSSAGYVAVNKMVPGVPGTSAAYATVSPIEQKVWDRVNQVGVGNYTLGRVTSPVKKTIRNVADPLGRAAYRQANILIG